MQPEHTPDQILVHWSRILGSAARIVDAYPGRDLWLVEAEDGSLYYLKKYGPWRNLPLADEARILDYLASTRVQVAELIPTDHNARFAGAPEESYVLMPRLENAELHAADVLASEVSIGRAMACLHTSMATYTGDIDSYTENLQGALAGDLMLPPPLMEQFLVRRAGIIASLTDLPMQLIHGDMTPGNILMLAPGEVAGFIDFDHLPVGPRIWDIAKYLSRRLRLAWREDDPIATHTREAHVAPFLRGYQAQRSLSCTELAALPSLILAGNVIESSYFAEISSGKLQRRMLDDHEQVMLDSIEAAAWQLSHWDDVAWAVASV